MTTDCIVASLPALEFDVPCAMSRERFAEIAGEEALVPPRRWIDLETQLRNALVEARGGDVKYRRAAEGCSLYWKNRVLACFQEKDVMKREDMLDRVWWDAAGELTAASDPLGAGALATYRVRLGVAIKRTGISKDAGNAAFDRLTAITKEVI